MTDEGERDAGKIVVVIDKDLEDLIPGYIVNRYNDIEAIRRALAAGDFESIRILGHSMKGSGGGYGFDAITDIGRTIENAAKEKNGADISGGADKLLYYLQGVEVVYK